MLEIGKSYKLKKIDIKDNDEVVNTLDSNDEYKILGIYDKNKDCYICVNNTTNEPYLFHSSAFIDPDFPDDDTTIMTTVKEQLKSVLVNPKSNLWNIDEEGGCCAAASAGGGCGVSCSASCGCGSTQAAIATGQSSAGPSAVTTTVPCAPVGHIYGAMVNGKPVQGKSVGRKKKKRKKNEELAEQIYVTPQQMVDEVQETFDPYEELVTIVENNRQKLKITVKYTDPDSKILTHSIIKEWLDEGDEILDTEIIEDITLSDCVDTLCAIFYEFGYTNDVFTSIDNEINKLLSESYDTKEQQINLFENALELQSKFISLTEMSPKTEAMIAYLELLETMQKNDLLEEFVAYAKSKDIEDLSLDLLESVDEQEIISRKIAQKLTSLNFVFADTKECVYKREGNYKHLIKYDQENNKIIYKVFNGDDVVEEKSWDVNNKEDVVNIFDEISNLLEGRE